jgi:GT2 family glycosyltransferase/tetratricopeptide (TPR) repeat protein
MGTASLSAALSDLLALIPASARRILDLRASTPELAAALQARQPVDEHLLHDLAADEEALPGGPFDCIVGGDALEHVAKPEEMLLRFRALLVPGGSLIAAFGNMRHHGVVTSLLEGTWACGAEGLSKARAIRFFTRREIEKLFYRAGFTIRELKAIPGEGYAEWEAQGRPGATRIGFLHLGGLPEAEAEEFYIERYLAHVTPTESPDHGLTSVVIVTHNQLPYTRLCVDSIRLCTTEPYELVFVDNASTDGTPDYLRSLGAKVITNNSNRGFPVAANQGMQAATGKQILLLNNDCVVTTGWLGRLLQGLHRDSTIGLIGPCSNRISGEQQVTVTYDDDQTGLDGFAWDWGKRHDSHHIDTDRLVGFCLLVRRDLFERIGLLDERFGIGCFEDDDYCKRALQAGYRAVIATDAFVHHFAGRTFIGSGVDFASLMRQNEQLFRDKWANPQAAPTPPSQPSESPPPRPGPFTIRVAPGGGLLLVRKTVQLSLCMIVRDNARTIKACLESIRPWVDEMVVVDTGSKDDTPQIAASLGARVFHFPWCDSFAAARNESLRLAQGSWIFWMDSDDTIDEANGRTLRQLALYESDPKVLGHVMQVHCPGPGDPGQAELTIVDHVKLFRNLPALRFEGRIHEQIIPAIRRAGGDIAWSSVFVVHSGYDHSPEGQAKKKERDLHLLHLELQEQPQHPFTLFNLGMTYADIRQFERAVDYLQRCIAVSGEGESHLRKAYALLVHSFAQLGKTEEAWQTCSEGLQLFPKDAELLFRKGLVLHEAGRMKQAVEAYLTLLQTDEDRHFSSVVRGIKGFLAHHNLALAYGEMGAFLDAEKQWHLVMAEVPEYPPAWYGLADLLIRQRKHHEAKALANRLVANPRHEMHGLTIQGQITAAQGELDTARHLMERAVNAHPKAVEPLQALCRLLFDHATPAQAEMRLRQLLRRCPQDAASHHNLGTLCMKQGRFDEAIIAYRQSLQHRPRATATHLHLGHALQASGRTGEAVTAWEEVLRLDPGHTEAGEALRQVQPTES